MTCFVILLNWNGGDDTIACLESVMQQRGVTHRVIVCDNASTDNSVEVLRNWAAGKYEADLEASPLADRLNPVPKPLVIAEYDRASAERVGARGPADVHLIHTGANLGFAGGCNVGLRFVQAGGGSDHVWLLNNDTVVEPDALAALLERANWPDRPGIVGSLLCYFDDPQRVQSMGGGTYSPWRAMSRHIREGELRRPLSPDEARDVEARMAYVVGASMLVSRDFIDRVGLMQEDYFLYFEEIDWVERGKRTISDLSLGFAPGSVVYHKVGASAGTHVRSMNSLRFLTVNRLRFVKRFYRGHLAVARLAVAWEGFKALLKGRFAEARLALSTAASSVKA